MRAEALGTCFEMIEPKKLAKLLEFMDVPYVAKAFVHMDTHTAARILDLAGGKLAASGTQTQKSRKISGAHVKYLARGVEHYVKVSELFCVAKATCDSH